LAILLKKSLKALKSKIKKAMFLSCGSCVVAISRNHRYINFLWCHNLEEIFSSFWRQNACFTPICLGDLTFYCKIMAYLLALVLFAAATYLSAHKKIEKKLPGFRLTLKC